MKNNPLIAPSILSADFGRFSEEISDIEKAGADWLHVDVMDGTFVPQITFGTKIVEVAKKACKLFLDVHLMIVEPWRHLDAFAKAGADRITVHLEVCPDPAKVLNAIRGLGVSPGITISPDTSVDKVLPFVELSDLVLIMTVRPGKGGQEFMAECLPKISEVNKRIAALKRKIHLQVDGGINTETAKLCAAHGANVFVAGAFVFGKENRAHQISLLRQAGMVE